MARNGFAKLWRRSEDHWLFNLKPFDPWHAWEYLWGVMASWEDSQVIYQDRLHILKRGQLVTSISHLARKWGWSRGKVRRLITQLTAAGMIFVENGQRVLLITICNYGRWQDRLEERTDRGQIADRSRTDRGQIADTDKEDLEGKEEKEVEERRQAELERPQPPEVSKEEAAEALALCVKHAETLSPEAAQYTLDRYEDSRSEPDPEIKRALLRRVKEGKELPAHP